ncbi:MAG: peptidoglycan editing factor PgeF [candidate division NC10 bacterium]|nr:peptidoglycan editing factor PgeF [candidate division NC10 bacterium]
MTVQGLPRPNDQPPVVRSFLLGGFCNVSHAFSTRQGGVSREPFASLNLGASVGDDPGAVAENRRRFFGSLGISPDQIVRVKQVHGKGVLLVNATLAGRPGFPQPLSDGGTTCDAMVTGVPGMALTVSTADCTPILVVDPVRRAVAAVHAGWPSTGKRIVVETLIAMRRAYGTDPADCRVAVGPSIRGCCYEVDEPVASAMATALPTWETCAVPTRFGHWRLDLAKVNRSLLEAAGVPRDQIEDLGLCTACRRDLFFSHRAEKGKTGRMMNVIMIRAESREPGAEKRVTRET